MLFNSYPFLFIYLPITLLGTFVIGRYSYRLAIMWLGGASIVFYGLWNLTFVSLLLGSIIVNFEFGRWLTTYRNTTNRSNKTLALAITSNLLLLGYFKYCNFFISSFAHMFGNEFIPFNIILPLGISFFTFTQIGFLIDVSRGLTREASLSRYLLFVTYFPHLIAGPLLHHKEMMPQFSDRGIFKFNPENVSLGLTIFVLALAKKVFLADSFGEIVDPIFNAAEHGQTPMLIEAWTGSLAYSMQMYFDFSAYSEMAIGLSLLFNIRLPLNFNSPFKATNVIEYWQRWHMSLTKYIYEYLYTPITVKFMRIGLGKSKFVEAICAVLIPTFITFLLIGLWHGANWTFIAFGVLHGIYMVTNYGWHALKKKQGWVFNRLFHRMLACALTYIAVTVALVVFRATDLATAFVILKGMAGLNGISLPATITHALPINLSALGVVFLGVLPNQQLAMHPMNIFLLLLVGHATVWLLPNMSQLMSRYNIALNERIHSKNKSLKFSKSIFSSTVWQPTLPIAIAIGLLFFSLIVAMATNKPSTFLYYQF
jgi:alginate O-acetyltransferase complex protein AlgI